MSYVLGYITADGCITVSKDRKRHPFSLNITSAEDLMHLGIFPRKTCNLGPIDVPKKYFPDFVRGFLMAMELFIFIK